MTTADHRPITPTVRAAVRRSSCPSLIGRDAELDQLVALIDTPEALPPAIALIAGRAGIGKTRLVEEATGRWSEKGMQVLRGSCLPIEGAPPYGALAEALATAGPLAPEAAAAFAGTSAGSRSRIFELARAELWRAIAGRPTVFVVEDLHWSDKATRDLLVYLASRVTDVSWALVLSFRYEGPLERRELAAFTDALERRPVLRLALDVLGVEDVAALIGGITGAAATAEAASDVHRRSGGIPLLIEELVASGGPGVPDHLRSLFLARVAALGPAARPVTDVVAIAADPADEFLVAAVLDRPVEEVRRALAHAADADLLAAEPHGYRLRHELLREVVCDDLAPGLRRELHARVAAFLAPRSAPALLAHHWYHGGRPVEAALASLAAAEESDRTHAPAATHLHLERVLELWSQLDSDVHAAAGGRNELLRRTAVAAERAGAFARAAALAKERLELGADDALARAPALERLARYRWQAGDGPGARTAYEEAVGVLTDDAPLAVRAKVLSGHAWFLGATYDLDAAKVLSERARQLAQDVDDPAVRWQVLLSWGVARLGQDDGHLALREARDLAVTLDTGYNTAVSLLWLNNSLQIVGAPAEREDTLRTALEQVAVHGLGRSVEASVSFMLAELMLETGRWDEADRILNAHRDGGVQGMSRYFISGLRARLAAWRGDAPGLAQSAAEAAELAARVPQQPIPHAISRMAKAEALLWSGDGVATTAARQALDLAAGDAVYRLEALTVLARAEADAAVLARRRGGHDPDDAGEELLHTLDGFAPANAQLRALSVTVTAEVERLRGHRDPLPWRAAVDAWAATADRYRLAYARWRLAWALLGSRSGRAEATAQAHLAMETATDLGAAPLLGAVEAQARTARLAVSTPMAIEGTAFELGLTPRELEVLPLLASGRTNAEIATALVISPRTVGVHVSQILRKLGAARRTEAADLARRAGLLDD
jgi:DNA-binding CsgD family transcriptional regulator